MLDGGLPAWVAEGRPVTKDVPAPKRGTMTPRPQPLVVDGDWVAAHLRSSGIALVDARSPEFYSGEKPGGKPPENGHIPGARSIPYSSLLEESGRFKSRDALVEAFRVAGVKPGDRVVSYCHIGQQATLVFLVAKSLGFDAALYDGSFEDWSARGGAVER
jgi:thiosulfate/3-mercaptopyruvate sulfurtransferase